MLVAYKCSLLLQLLMYALPFCLLITKAVGGNDIDQKWKPFGKWLGLLLPHF